MSTPQILALLYALLSIPAMYVAVELANPTPQDWRDRLPIMLWGFVVWVPFAVAAAIALLVYLLLPKPKPLPEPWQQKRRPLPRRAWKIRP